MLASFLERVSYCKELAELSHMNVESGVVVPRHQPFDFVGVKHCLIFQRGQFVFSWWVVVLFQIRR